MSLRQTLRAASGSQGTPVALPSGVTPRALLIMPRAACGEASMKSRILLALAFVLAATAAFAQAPFPGAVLVNGGWVPCDHPVAITAGRGCVAAPGSPATTPTVVVPPNDGLGTRFELGKTYESPYGFRVTIIGTVRKTDGSFVFVAEVVKSTGAPAKGEILQFPVDQDRGAFNFEVPADLPIAMSAISR